MDVVAEGGGITTLWRVLRLLAIAYVAYLGLVFALQRVMAFPGAFRDAPRAEPTAPEGAEQLWLETSFGRVEAWLFRAPVPERAPTIVFTHGNGELIDDWDGALSRYTDAGANVVALEFPGYGFSDGKPTRRSIREAVEVAYDTLAARPEIDSGRIVAHGRSMGGGAATELASGRPIAALVLQSTFSSAAAMAHQALAPGFLVRDRFDNAAALRSFEGPVLVMHGRADDVIPFAHAERLAAARPGLTIEELDCAHNDCGRVWPDVVARVMAFLEKNRVVDD